MRNWALSIRFLLLYLVTGILPLLVLLLVFVNSLTQQTIEDSIDLYSVEIQQIGSRLESFFGQNAETCFQLSSDTQLINYLNPARKYTTYMQSIDAYYGYLKPLVYNQFMMGNRQERLRIYYLNESLMQGYGIYQFADDEVQGRPAFVKAVEAGQQITWWYDREADTINLARSIRDVNNRLYGVMEIILSKNELASMIQDIDAALMRVALLDDSGDVVLSNSPELADEMTDEEPLSQASGEVTRLNGGRDGAARLNYRLGGGMSMPAWGVRMEIPMNALIYRNQARRNSILLAGIVVTVLAALIFFVMLRRELRRLNPLLRSMRRVREGELQRVEVPPSRDEIGEIIENYNRMVHDLDALIKENYGIQLKRREAELYALESQLNPHFLHNILENLRMRLVVSGDPSSAQMILLLSQMLRKSMNWKRQFITLGEELSFVENYLQLQQLRYDSRLRYEIAAGEEVRSARVPKFIIQPLVENAIKHGLTSIKHGGNLWVRVGREGDDLRVEVADDSDKITRQACRDIAHTLSLKWYENPGERVGIHNVHQRLAMEYGEGYGVVSVSPLDETDGKGWVIALTLPFQAEVDFCTE